MFQFKAKNKALKNQSLIHFRFAVVISPDRLATAEDTGQNGFAHNCRLRGVLRVLHHRSLINV
jgi:hypothetical protein